CRSGNHSANTLEPDCAAIGWNVATCQIASTLPSAAIEATSSLMEGALEYDCSGASSFLVAGRAPRGACAVSMHARLILADDGCCWVLFLRYCWPEERESGAGWTVALISA